MALYKDLSCKTYWQDFGRGAIGAAFLPSPTEAAETVLALMAREELLTAELARTKASAKAAIQPIELLALRLSNDLDEIRASIRRATDE